MYRIVTTKPTRSVLSPESRPILEDIRQWFATPLGEHVLSTESAMLEQLLSGLFGYHLTQFSIQDRSLFSSSPIRHKIRVGLDDSRVDSVVTSPAQLPFANDSIDVILLHHLLDFIESPQEVLREIARVTLPLGHLVIVGFNPLSMWGFWHQFARFGKRAPWSGQFIRPGRLMDWLNLLNFKIDRAQYAIYRPPSQKYPGRVSDYSQGVSRNLNLPIGSVYVIVAKKHIGAMTPIRPIWKSTRAFGRLSVVRSVKHHGMTTIEHEPGRD